jgi:hypothetical protein
LARHSPQLIELTLHWYGILAKEGFKDIESLPTIKRDGELKRFDSLMFTVTDPEQAKFKSVFFHYAEQFLEAYPFESQADRQIWRLYAQGRGERTIVDEINRLSTDKRLNIIGTKLKTANRASVRAVLARLRPEFRKYLNRMYLEEEADLMGEFT